MSVAFHVRLQRYDDLADEYKDVNTEPTNKRLSSSVHYPRRRRPVPGIGLNKSQCAHFLRGHSKKYHTFELTPPYPLL